MYVDPELLRRVDNAIRFDLESWRVMFFHWLIGSSILVAVGVGLEGPEVVHEARNIWLTTKREASAWIKLIGLAGWILVVVGVLGEGVFEGAFSISDGQLQTFDEILLTAAQREAGDAATSAHNAAIDAGNAHDLAQSASDIARLAKETAETAKGRADAALATLVQEQKLRLEFEAAVRPRELPFRVYEDGTTNVDDLAKFKGIGVKILYEKDAEAMRTASNLVSLFRRAGWRVISTEESTQPFLPDGVTFVPPTFKLYKHGLSSINLAETLQAWLGLNGWEANAFSSKNFGEVGPNEIEVKVGFKPNPYFDDPVAKQAKAKKLNTIRDKAPNANPDKKVKRNQLEFGDLLIAPEHPPLPLPSNLFN